MMTPAADPRYAVCVSNEGFTVSLLVRRIYRVLDDTSAERRGLLRVIDETGGDYLYPAELFLPVELPRTVDRLFASGKRS